MHPQKLKSRTLFRASFTGSEECDITSYLKNAAPLSGRELRRLFFAGLVRVNDRKAHSAKILKPGDRIEVFAPQTERRILRPESMPLQICFENDLLLVINKPAGIAVHPSGAIAAGTLAHGVAAYFEGKGLPLKVRPVNRLDYGTSGLVVFAKSAAAQTELEQAIQSGRVKRIYQAAVAGKPEPPTGSIKLPIGSKNGRHSVVADGKNAVTHYRTLQSFGAFTLLELELETGRTHQIRIHLAAIGSPILGDHEYGLKNEWISRPALHAARLVFDPVLGIPELNAPLPQYFGQLLSKLKAAQSTESR
jgi:23S rRNA pseudouridine1911/1915/1917 synthase